MSTENKKTKLILSLIALVSAITGTVWSGYVITLLWKWFVVPTFGLPLLSIPLAIGLALLLTMFRTTPDSKPKQEATEVLGRVIGESWLKPAMLLAFGAIVKHFL